MGGMLSGLDQRVISGALLYMPDELHLSTSQASLTRSAVPLSATGGAVMLGPINECVAGAINFGMIVAQGSFSEWGWGLEGDMVPVYVTKPVERRHQSNMVSLYRFVIAFGEVVGYVVAAVFATSPLDPGDMHDSWLVFRIIMLIGIVFMPESSRMAKDKGKTLEAFRVWNTFKGWRTPKIERNSPSCMIIALEQLTSINAIMYNMSTLTSQIGFDRKQSVFMFRVDGEPLFLGIIGRRFGPT
ncbi:uncharacterized protein Z518_04121 [Rhinocladiella mackenziei CBS 650.93]|uniref:Major facilitator superfamily (MFS) profile domain-containing protein n=1 Tax=Rhinocladiella mackenziei CBS 650.93 TaxID=1442369 RepID=A0A0D2FVG7_9EURO|nr:uncharacterized protein Z518_04121 [Rhinocladiella mackenziei CBS 650.93]KIX06147.1 hypothetical protein Z518_04121 [Rhinocladiella mackenziei CBS 650.93]